MFSKIVSGLKQLGKKAIGWVRGMNGDKAAAWAGGALTGYNPTMGAVASPFLALIGKKINDRLDSWIANNVNNRKSGIQKPNYRRRDFQDLDSVKTLYESST
jgi:hypothetical protein